jgi:hypothetical protein
VANDGNVMNAVSLSTPGTVPAVSFPTTPTPTVLNTTSTSDLLLLKLDASTGDVLLAKSYGGSTTSDNTVPERIIQDGSDNYYVCGRYEGSLTVGATTETSVDSWDSFIIKLDSNADPIWFKSFGGNNVQSFKWLVADDSESALYAMGYFRETITIGSDTLTPLGTGDVFVTKLDMTTGDPIWSRQYGGAGDDDRYVNYGSGIGLYSGDIFLGMGIGEDPDPIDFGGIFLNNTNRDELLAARICN